MPRQELPVLFFDFRSNNVIRGLPAQAMQVLEERGLRTASYRNEISDYIHRMGKDARPRVICKITSKFVQVIALEFEYAQNVLGPAEALWYARQYPGHTMALAMVVANLLEKTPEELEAWWRITWQMLDDPKTTLFRFTMHADRFLTQARWYHQANGRWPRRLERNRGSIVKQMRPLYQAFPAPPLMRGLEDLLGLARAS